MKNKLWLIVLAAVIGFSFAACGDSGGGGGDSGGNPFNGTWKDSDGETLTLNNGNFEVSENNKGLMKGTYTVIADNITMVVKELHGDALNEMLEDDEENIDITFEDKWYNKNQVIDVFKKWMKDRSVPDAQIADTINGLSDTFNAMFPTITGIINGNTITFEDGSSYTKDGGSTGPGTGPGTSPGGDVSGGGDMTWTAITDSPFDEFVQAIAFGNGKFVAGSGYSGKNGKLATSTDGTSWTEIPPTTALDIINPNTGNVATDKAGIYAITFGNGKFVAAANSSGYVATVSSMNNSRIVYSQNGTTWTLADDVSSIFGTSWIHAIAWGNNKFVAGGAGGKMAYSSDGITWIAVTDSTFGTDRNTIIAWGNNMFVAGTSHGDLYYSADGITWTAVSGYVISSWAIAWGNNKFVAGGYGSMAYWDGN